MNSKTIYTKLLPDGRMLQKQDDGNWAEIQIPPLGSNFPKGEPAYAGAAPQISDAQSKL